MKESLGVRKGAWCREEDELLKACIQKYGEGKWHLVPQRAGLNRCRKSCRMRWLNYLKPNIKRGDFSEDEIDMIKRFHKLLGNRWSLIAGRLPGRTSNDVKNYWNSYIRKKGLHPKEDKEKPENKIETHVVIKPQPRTLSRNLPSLREKPIAVTDDTNGEKERAAQPCPASPPQQSEHSTEWWEILLNDKGDGKDRSWFLEEQEENVFLDHSDGNLFVKSQSLDDFP